MTYPPPDDPPVQAYQPPVYPVQNGYPVQPQNPYASQQPYDYGYAGSPYAHSPYPGVRRPTEGLAIASLVVSCVSVLGLCAWSIGGLLGVVGAVLGHVARRRIRTTGAQGEGMALAGIIVGWIIAGLGLLGAIFFAVVLFADVGSSSRY
ncbi:DUF4190 domain-containing protein [Actinoplanes sp. NPDC051494]|uniref:DUF4190 domain-containing protein n=1 Tax=Actinoplanes sp. NPDC051494 TaxID=3363907 RepID=UPI0037B96714